VAEEQQEIFGECVDADVTQEHLSRMKYLDACVKEALRFFPSVPIIGRRLEADIAVDGQLVPKDTTVIVFILGVHRNPFVWKDPEVFKPERFLHK
jgi:cytochrome P450